jgi:transposase-like protein
MNQEMPMVYTFEFIESAEKLTDESDKSIVQTVRNLGNNESTLNNRINKYSQPVAPFKAVRIDEHLHEELKRQKQEVAQLTEDLNLLKIADVHFVLCQGTTVDYMYS